MQVGRAPGLGRDAECRALDRTVLLGDEHELPVQVAVADRARREGTLPELVDVGLEEPLHERQLGCGGLADGHDGATRRPVRR